MATTNDVLNLQIKAELGSTLSQLSKVSSGFTTLQQSVTRSAQAMSTSFSQSQTQMISNMQSANQLADKMGNGLTQGFMQATAGMTKFQMAQVGTATTMSGLKTTSQGMGTVVKGLGSAFLGMSTNIGTSVKNMVLYGTAGKTTREELSGMGRVSNGLSTAMSGVSKASSGMKTAFDGVKVSGSALGSIASGMLSKALMGVAGLALGAVSSAFAFMGSQVEGAIERFDAMKRFPIIMAAVGVSADDSAKSLQRIRKHIEGLPTDLGTATKGVSMLTSSLGDVGKAEDYFYALNNAVVLFTGNANGVARTVQQFAEELGKGKFDAESFNSMLNNGMSPALTQIAKHLLGAEATVGELKSAMSEGAISGEQFGDALVELNKKGMGSMEAMEKTVGKASDTLQGNFARLKTAVQDAMAAFMGSGAGTIMSDMLKGVVNWVKQAASWFKQMGSAVTPFIKGIMQTTSGLIKFLDASGLTNLVMTQLKVGMGLLAAAILALQLALYGLQQVVELVMTGLNALGIVSDKSLKKMKESGEDLRSGIDSSMKGIDAAINGTSEKTKKAMDADVASFKSGAAGASAAADDTVTAVQSQASTVLNATTSFGSAYAAQMGSAFGEGTKAAQEAAAGLTTTVGLSLSDLATAVSYQMGVMKDGVVTDMALLADGTTVEVQHLADGVTKTFQTMSDGSRVIVTDMGNGIKETMKTGLDGTTVVTQEGANGILGAYTIMKDGVILNQEQMSSEQASMAASSALELQSIATSDAYEQKRAQWAEIEKREKAQSEANSKAASMAEAKASYAISAANSAMAGESVATSDSVKNLISGANKQSSANSSQASTAIKNAGDMANGITSAAGAAALGLDNGANGINNAGSRITGDLDRTKRDGSRSMSDLASDAGNAGNSIDTSPWKRATDAIGGFFSDLWSNVTGWLDGIIRKASSAGSSTSKVKTGTQSFGAQSMQLRQMGTFSSGLNLQNQSLQAAQPMQLQLQMGASTYRGFTDDISAQQGMSINLRKSL